MRSLFRFAALGVMLIAYPLVATAQVPTSWLGTWKMNPSKSTADPGPMNRSSTVRIEAVAGGGMKFVVDTVTGEGKTTHNELVTMFNRKEAEYKGATPPETRLYSRIDDRSYQWVSKVNGKVTTTTRSTVSADGKTRTNMATGTNTAGKAVHNTTVYDRQ